MFYHKSINICGATAFKLINYFTGLDLEIAGSSIVLSRQTSQ